MSACRINDCERDGKCAFKCRDCGETYPSDERECPNCGLRSALQFCDEGCGTRARAVIDHPVEVARRLAEDRVPPALRPAGWEGWWAEMKLIADEEITAEQAAEEYRKFCERHG